MLGHSECILVVPGCPDAVETAALAMVLKLSSSTCFNIELLPHIVPWCCAAADDHGGAEHRGGGVGTFCRTRYSCMSKLIALQLQQRACACCAGAGACTCTSVHVHVPQAHTGTYAYMAADHMLGSKNAARSCHAQLRPVHNPAHCIATVCITRSHSSCWIMP